MYIITRFINFVVNMYKPTLRLHDKNIDDDSDYGQYVIIDSV